MWSGVWCSQHVPRLGHAPRVEVTQPVTCVNKPLVLLVLVLPLQWGWGVWTSGVEQWLSLCCRCCWLGAAPALLLGVGPGFTLSFLGWGRWVVSTWYHRLPCQNQAEGTREMLGQCFPYMAVPCVGCPVFASG